MNSKPELTAGSILLATALLIAGCGGGGGGGAPTAAVTGFTKTVTLPNNPGIVNAGDWTSLFSPGAGSRRYLAVVRAPDLSGSGPLRSLALRFGAASSGNRCPNVTIKLVHLAAGVALNTVFANSLASAWGAPMIVLNSTTLSIPSGAAGDYFTLPLNGAFHYNGVDDLIVDIESDACDTTTVLDAHDASPVSTAMIYNATDRASITGSVWNSLADMRFTFAGGDNRVQSPGSAGMNSIPFDIGARKIQLLYYPDEINGSGPITGIAFPIEGGSGFPPGPVTEQTHTVTVKLGHTTLADLTTTYADNFNSGRPVTVANAVSFEIPAGTPVGRYLWVPLPDAVFSYNGRQNLLVELETTPSPEHVWVSTHRAGLNQRRLYASSDVALSGATDSVVNDIQLRFAGGSMDVMTPGGFDSGTSDGFPFYATEGKRQFLYRAAELGTRGTISKFACRTSLSGVAETGFNYSVVLSHSTTSILGGNFAANLSSPVTVFSGSLNLPAITGGDWVEIPLTTPFAYNGRDNLVMEISGSGGMANGFACASDSTPGSAVLYAGRRLFGSTPTSTVGPVSDTMINTRFTLQ